MLSDTHQDGARELIERIRLAVAAIEIPHATGTLHLTVSAGLALHLPGDTVEHTLERADQALYTAKALGRNRVVVAPAVPSRRAGAHRPATR
ncbi:MAG: diguanylate cyclase, partial [Burkholderiaceae bacterium]|nr:diguanylate cyclase [Burkholderiaceae bacterium]